MTFSRCVVALAVSLAFVNGMRCFAQPSVKNEQEPLPDGALWRLGTMRLRHLSEVRQVAFTPDGKHVASLGMDHVFSLWDLKTGIDARRFPLSDKAMRESVRTPLNPRQVEILMMVGRLGG